MKVSKYVMAGLLVGTILTTTTAHAEDLICTISGTGPDSTNTCVEFVGRTCTVTNNNTIIITNSSTQQGSSGSGSNSGNTNGGGAATGDTSNTNGSVVNGTIDNTGACVAAAAPVTPTPTPATETPSTGQVESAQVVAPVGGVGAGEGGSDMTLPAVGLLAASLLAIGIGARQLQRRSL